jgi:ATP-dependent exoDNAse (exonuclease V) beta subunit
MSLVVYKSSAGSGKTTTLVNEYLSIALKYPQRFSAIIGLTFTIKATGEMKDRVLKVLDKIIHLDKHRDDPGLMAGLEHIRKKSGLNEEQLRKNASILIRNILHNYTDFAFSTIDSFVVGIVRSFARDLNLPVDFAIELEQDPLIEQAIERLYARIGRDENLTIFLINYIFQNIDNEKNFRIDHDLQQLAKNLFMSKHYKAIDKLDKIDLNEYRKIIKEMQRDTEVFKQKAKAFAQEALDLLDTHHIEHSWFTSKSYPAQLIKITNGKFDPNHNIIKNPEKIIKAPKSKKQEGAAIEAVLTELLAINQKLVDLFEQDYKSFFDKSLILDKINPLVLLSEIKKELDDYCEENNLIHLSESNKKIAEIVLNEHIPFVYERVGRRYQNFLIDEFQDTSVIQWNNLLPLLDNSLAADNFNMIVGDAKQSIYRWRDGDVDQFIKLPEIANPDNSPIIKERAETLKRHFEQKQLNFNYRSEKNIIDFNNRFIRFLLDNVYSPNETESERINKVYENFKQEAGKTKENGKVVLRNFPDKESSEFEDALIGYIDDLQKQNYNLRDIAILGRTSKTLHRIAEVLIKNGISVVSSDTLYIQNNPDVRLIVSAIAYLASQERKNNLLNIMLLLAHKDKENGKEILQSNKNLIQNIGKENDSTLISKAFGLFGYTIDAQKLNQLQTYDLAEYLIQELGLNKTANPFLQSLMDHILDNSLSKGAGHGSFYEFWERKKGSISISLPEDIEAVKLYTIHKAKGLEFPVVIFPAVNFKRRGEMLWVDAKKAGVEGLKSAMISYKKELEFSSFAEDYLDEKDKVALDELNLIYVAITRPAEQLFILCDEGQSDSLWKLFKDFKEVKDPKLKILDDNHIIYGEMTSTGRAKAAQQTNSIDHIISNSWSQRLHIRKQAAFRKDAEQVARMQYGSLIHELLAEIQSKNDIHKAVQKALLSGKIQKEARTLLEQKLRDIITHPKVTPFFDTQNTILNEAAILLPEGTQKRPDRVILSKNKTLIIDYKTSDWHQISDFEQENHFKQLDEYRKILTKMGYPEIEAYLIYLSGEIAVIKVS